MKQLCLAILALMLACPAYGESNPTIRLSGPPVAESIPLLVMADSKTALPRTFKATFTPWHSPDQLRAMIAGDQIDAAIITTATACTLNNKGVRTRMALLFEAPLWIISSRTGPGTLESLKGTLLLPFGPGEMPELLYKAAVTEEKQLSTRHTGSALEAVNLLLSERGDHVMLSEPTASLAVLRSHALKDKDAPRLTRRVDLCRLWAEKFDNHRLAANGIAFFGSKADRRHPIQDFHKAYTHACQRVAKNPQRAIDIARTQYPALAAQVEKGIVKNMDIRVLPQKSSVHDAMFFLEKIMSICPAAIGGAMPKRDFFEALQ